MSQVNGPVEGRARSAGRNALESEPARFLARQACVWSPRALRAGPVAMTVLSACVMAGTSAHSARARVPSGARARGTAAKAEAARRPGRVVRGRVRASKGRTRLQVWARRRLEVGLEYDRGKIVVRRLDVKQASKPKRIRLFVGRFVARLYNKKKLVGSIQFDFPLLGSAAAFTKEGRRIVRRMAARMRTSTRVELPWDAPADAVVIFDKATRKSYAVPLTALKAHPLCRPGTKAAGKTRPHPRTGAGAGKAAR